MSKNLKQWISLFFSALLIMLIVSALSEDKDNVENWKELVEEAQQKQDYETAFQYAEIGAKSEDVEALYLTGSYYYYGKGTEQSYEKALNYLLLAAEQGEAQAQQLLGEMYFYGNGVEKSMESSLKYT